MEKFSKKREENLKFFDKGGKEENSEKVSVQILKGEEYLDMVKKLGHMKIQALRESLSDADPHKNFKQIALRILKE